MWQALKTRLFPVQFISPSCLPFPLKDHSIFTFPPLFFPLCFCFFNCWIISIIPGHLPGLRLVLDVGETETETEWLGNICDELIVNIENYTITSECSLIDSSVTTSLRLPSKVPGMLKTHTQMCLWCATCRVVVVRNTTYAFSHVTAGGPLLVLWWKVT